MKRRLKLLIISALICAFTAALLRYPAGAAAAALNSLRLGVTGIVPSLFPFMVVSRLCVALGLAELAGRRLSRLAGLLSLSGAGLSAFALGLFGGYPLGAATVCQLYDEGRLHRSEAARLLAFCDNCGPAFAVSVAGASVFGSAKYGFFLFAVQCLAAVLLALFTKKSVTGLPSRPRATAVGFADAFTGAVRSSALTCLSLCGFVVFFGVLLGLLELSGLLPRLCGELSAGLGLELHFVKSALSGLLELSSGVGSMAGLRPAPASLALASFILAWGGLSVQAQAASVIAASGLPVRPHIAGKAAHTLLAAAAAYALCPLVL